MVLHNWKIPDLKNENNDNNDKNAYKEKTKPQQKTPKNISIDLIICIKRENHLRRDLNENEDVQYYYTALLW